jgi:multidrug efflux pump
MNISAPFIRRPVATTLLSIAITLAGLLGFARLPVAPLPQIDFPTIAVVAALPGASPNTMATSVARPLERHLGHIADVATMTSESSTGQTVVTLQFDLNRSIDGAARDVQAAINAARNDLPASLPINPSYHKFNPADAPILILALTSKTLTQGQIYDAASNLLAPRLSQLNGIGNIGIGGSALPAVRVELNPHALYKYGIAFEDIRAALASANANSPKGIINDGNRHYQIYTNDQATTAADYAPLIIAYRDGAALRLSDVANISDSVQDLRNLGLSNNESSVLLILFREPGANVIKTIDTVKVALPHLQAAIPADIAVQIAVDPSAMIRASLFDTELTLLIAVALVTLVVYVFLRSVRATVIAAIVLPIAIIGTFGVMHLLGFSLNNLSLMALTIATGFIVDDVIVVLENIARHTALGIPRLQAAFRGAREVGITVLSISFSLIAVFIPILFMGGILGRVFREFIVTLSIAILLSLALSLTTAPMLYASLFPTQRRESGSNSFVLARVIDAYEYTLDSALRRRGLVLLVFLVTIIANITLLYLIPKGLFPQQDTGRLYGWFQADQTISFAAMSAKLRQATQLLQQDPAVTQVIGFTGAGSGFGGSSNTATALISLKALPDRASAEEIIARLRPKLGDIPGANLYLGAIQDFAVGANTSAQYQYTLLSESAEDLLAWAPKLAQELEHCSTIAEVKYDQKHGGLEAYLEIDRDSAARLGINPLMIDNTLYDAFGQRQVSVIYNARSQYHVVMEADPRYAQDATSLRDIYIAPSGALPAGTAMSNAPTGTVTPARSYVGETSKAPLHNQHASRATFDAARNVATNSLDISGRGNLSSGSAVSTVKQTMIPLAAISHYRLRSVPLSVSHQGSFVASGIAFSLRDGATLNAAIAEINDAAQRVHLPASIHGELSGAARVFQQSLMQEALLFVAAIASVYILLGLLYENYVHPLTILSTLPTAGLGALLALMLLNIQFDIIGMIGVILLIGIVLKNAIIMLDFAIVAERQQGLTAKDAIVRACVFRFRPILMTSVTAVLGAMPLALSFGAGAEIRRPLGISIIGGLVASQLLTLYTTPVIYLCMHQMQHWSARQRRHSL